MKFGCSIGIFLNSANLICRSTDISKCFRGSLRLRDNESRLYCLSFIKCNTPVAFNRINMVLFALIWLPYQQTGFHIFISLCLYVKKTWRCTSLHMLEGRFSQIVADLLLTYCTQNSQNSMCFGCSECSRFNFSLIQHY